MRRVLVVGAIFGTVAMTGLSACNSEASPPPITQQPGWTGIDASGIVPSGRSGFIEAVSSYDGHIPAVLTEEGLAWGPHDGNQLTAVIAPGRYLVGVSQCDSVTPLAVYDVTVIAGRHAIIGSADGVQAADGLSGAANSAQPCSPGTGSR